MDSYTIVDDGGRESKPMPKENFTNFIEQQKLSIASNGVLYSQDRVGVIPEILNVWFDKRVEYKNEMKKYGKAEMINYTNSIPKDSLYKRLC